MTRPRVVSMPPRLTSMTMDERPKRKRRPVGQAIGGILVGFDYQVFRATKPPAELVEAAKPIPPVPASGGGTIKIEIPRIPDGADPRAESAT
jgi:hypothetical protein